MGKQVSDDWLRQALLSRILLHEGCGPELAAQIVDMRLTETGGRSDLAEGSVYPALRRLEHDRFLVGTWIDVGEGRPRRRYYALTPKGRRAAEGRRVARARVSQAATGTRP